MIYDNTKIDALDGSGNPYNFSSVIAKYVSYRFPSIKTVRTLRKI